MTTLGLEARHFALLTEIALEPLTNAGCEIWAFGSRARGDQKKFSDLDLLIVGLPSSKLLSQIREQLEESSVPIKVDLVLDHELAQSYRTSVYQDRILLNTQIGLHPRPIKKSR